MIRRTRRDKEILGKANKGGGNKYSFPGEENVSWENVSREKE